MSKKEAKPTEPEMIVDGVEDTLSERERKRQEKAAAKMYLRSVCTVESMEVVEQVWPDILKALRLLFAKSRASTSRRRSSVALWAQVVDFLVAEGGSVDELTLFQKFRMSRSEARKMFRTHLKKSDPSDRVWASFDEKSERWVVLGTGEMPPAGYTGYIPS